MREDEAGKWVFMGQNSYRSLGQGRHRDLDLALNGKEDVYSLCTSLWTYLFCFQPGGGYGRSDRWIFEILMQSPEEHWKDVLGTEFGTVNQHLMGEAG